ncbi:hypothetical protein AUTU_19950 [Aureibacter tunicatorum]|nr:hypothetical protein AUTU_19950 [Aureibacter tunicatorum]
MSNSTKSYHQESHPLLQYQFLIKYTSKKGEVVLNAQSVSGLGFSMEQEGVDSTNGILRVPKGIQYEKLKIEKALFSETNYKGLLKDPYELFRNMYIQRDKSDVYIYLRNSLMDIQQSWVVKGAYPVSWKISDLNSRSSEVIITSIEFDYYKLIRVK